MTNVIFSVGVALPGGGMGNHAYYLTTGLERHNLLSQAFVMRYTGTGLPREKVQELYATEKIAYRLARYTHVNQYMLRDNLFDYWVSRQLGQASLFYGWTHHALWSLRRAKRLGMVTILERANSHPLTYTRLLEQEYRQRNMQKSPYHPWILKKHLHEIQTADYIAVTSDFTQQSLLEHGIGETRILLTSLGVDSDRYVPRSVEDAEGNCHHDDTFRVLYVGQICLRKGIPYLLEAWDTLQLKQAELLLVGDVVDEIRPILQSYLRQNTTITALPNTPNPVTLYQQASVSILPTLEDGFGLVVLEAMACGIPVIVTEHTGAKDCVRPETDGFIIPPASVGAIADTLKYCYTHRTHLRAMGYCARQQAEHFSWTRYQDGVAAHLRGISI